MARSLCIAVMIASAVVAQDDAANGAAASGETCYTSGDIAGSVLGTFFSTLTAVAVGFIVYWFVCRPRREKTRHALDGDVEAHAYDNPYFQDDDPGKVISIDIKAENGNANPDATTGKSPLANKNKVTSDAKSGSKKNKINKNNPFTSVFSNSKSQTIQRALDDSCIQQEPEKIEVRLRGCDFTGLGFNICGNIRHGIYVRDVLHRGPASESGKIKAGDRILGVTVCFDKITIEDALTILSYASPYDVTLYMQKTSEQQGGFHPGHQKRGSTASSVSGSGAGGNCELVSHPVYRSQSSDDVSQLTRDSANNKRSLSVGVVGPRLKKDSLSRVSPTHRVEPICEGGDVQIHNKSNKREAVVAVVVNENSEIKKAKKEDASPANTNPFIRAEVKVPKAVVTIDETVEKFPTADRKSSTQTSSAFIEPKNLTIEIPTFGLSEELAGEDQVNVVSNVSGAEVTEQTVVVHSPVHTPNAVRAISMIANEDSMKGFDIPTMDLEDIHISLEETMQQVRDGEPELQVERIKDPAPDISFIKQTIIEKLKVNPEVAKTAENHAQRLVDENATVELPRVDIKMPTVADFEDVDPGKGKVPQPLNTTMADPLLDENINYFETKVQSMLQKSPKVKPKRNFIPGKRKAPPPPNSQPSSPTAESDHNGPGNPFVSGIPSQAAVAAMENKSTSVVFLKPNNVTSVQVNAGGNDAEPRSPKRSRVDTTFGMGFMKTNFDEGLDKAVGEERFHSIPRTGLSSDKGASSRRAASLDDLTKIEEVKPLPLERAVSMDLNNADEPPVDQLAEIDIEQTNSSDERMLTKVRTETSEREATYKKSWEKLDHKENSSDKKGLEDWIEENMDKKSTALHGFFHKEKSTEQKKDVRDVLSQETDANANDVTYVAVPLSRTLSISSSSLSEDSIESESVNPRRSMGKGQMTAVDPVVKTYASDSESEEEKPRNYWPSTNNNLLSSPTDTPTRRSPSVTIPVIPPIINARELRTPSPSKEPHVSTIIETDSYSPATSKMIKMSHEQKSGENGEHNGTSSGSHDRYPLSNTDISVTTMHVTVSDGKGEVNKESYTLGSQGVIAKTVFIPGPQISLLDSNSNPGPESPPPILQPPE